MRFDLTDLRLFLRVVEAGSITHGAAAANMALPSASARLRGMEDLAGAPLLERGRRGVSPTPAGDALAHHARIVLRQMALMQGELGEFAKGLRGQVRLHANTAAATEFLPGLLGRFLAAHPRIDVEMKERTSRETVAAVAAGRTDIGIVSDAVETGVLRTFPFVADRLVLVLPRGHPLAGRRTLDLAAAAGERFIGLGDASPLQELVVEQAGRGGQRLSFRAHARTVEGVCRMVAEGAGLGIVPAAAASRSGRTMPVRRVALSDPWTRRRILLCVQDPDARPRPARTLLDHLCAAAQAQQAST